MKCEMLKGERVVLRDMLRKDAAAIFEHLKSRDMKKYTTQIPHPYTKQHALKFLGTSASKAGKGEALHFAITLRGDDALVGCISLEKISRENRNAELGYWLAKGFWGKGLMTEAVALVADYAFNKIKLHKLYASAFEENIASRMVLEKSGFKLEGIIKEQRFRFNRWHNEVRYGLIK